MRVFIPRFLWAALYFVVLTVAGVVGYIVIQGSTVHDALYMTVITLTAVGYSEVIPLTVMRRNFCLWDSPSWAWSMTPKGWRWSASIIPTS